MGIDYPANPKFTPDMNSGQQISTEFFLINSNSSWLKKNFQFIQAIFAGTMWLHMKYCIIQSPNVYHVLCPGRFQMYWAAMDSEVTFEGKLRKNEQVSEELMKLGVKSVDKGMLWPDAWKIRLTIRNLTPNSFNLYADYYERGYCSDEVAELADQISIEEMAAGLGSYFREISDDVTSIGVSEANKLMASNTFTAIKDTMSGMVSIFGDDANGGDGGQSQNGAGAAPLPQVNRSLTRQRANCAGLRLTAETGTREQGKGAQDQDMANMHKALSGLTSNQLRIRRKIIGRRGFWAFH